MPQHGLFACLYLLGHGAIANARPGSFTDAFFFSLETLATVGYGVMAPATLYGHVVSGIEIVTGVAFTALLTGTGVRPVLEAESQDRVCRACRHLRR